MLHVHFTEGHDADCATLELLNFFTVFGRIDKQKISLMYKILVRNVIYQLVNDYI